MNHERIKEIKDFKDEFNKKLEESYKAYEERIKKEKMKGKGKDNAKFKSKSLKKCLTTMGEEMEYKFAKDKGRQTFTSNLFQKSPPWQPNNGVGTYFGDFKRLVDGHDMSIWEKVNKLFHNYYIYFILFRTELVYALELILKK